MKIFLTLAIVFSSVCSYAEGWADYDYTGNCAIVDTDNNQTSYLDFYTKDLSQEESSGFIVWRVTDGKETEFIGGFDATFVVSADGKQMTIDPEDEESMTVPFGKDVVITGLKGHTATCNTKK